MTQRVMQEVLEYKESIGTTSIWYDYTLEQQSIMAWTADEILKILRNSKNTPPLMLIGSFAKTMYEYSKADRPSSYVFSVVCDATEDIIDSFLE